MKFPADKGWRFAAAALPIGFLAVFYFFPLAEIFGISFRPRGQWDLAGLKKLVATGYYAKTLWFTTWQAAASTVLTLIIALPGAFLFARYRFRGKELIQSLATVPFVLPTVVVAAAFQALLGPHGLVNEYAAEKWGLIPEIGIDRTVWFFLLAHVFFNYAVVLRIVGGFWANLPPNLTEAARMLGASKWTAFRKVTLPLLLPAISAAALLIFIFCFTSFSVILILGGPGFATIEVAIYRQAVHYFNLPLAAALSIIQIAFTFGLMWAYTHIGRKAAVPLFPESSSSTQKPLRKTPEKIMAAAVLSSMALLLLSPLLALAGRSFVGENGLTLTFYRALFESRTDSLFYVSPLHAVFNSIGFALAAMIMALALGLCAASFLAGGRGRLRSLMDPVFMLPLSTSAVTLGFGFVVALDEPPLNLRSSIMLAPLAHTLVAFPFVVRALLPALQSIPPRLREAAAVLGASPVRAWRHVVLPIVGRAMLAGSVFAFSISLGEFGATAFVARPQTATMPLAVFRYLGQPGAMNYGQAMAMSTILMLVTALAFVALEKLRPGRMEVI